MAPDSAGIQDSRARDASEWAESKERGEFPGPKKLDSWSVVEKSQGRAAKAGSHFVREKRIPCKSYQDGALRSWLQEEDNDSMSRAPGSGSWSQPVAGLNRPW